jgi:hypothetical protein
MSRQEHPVRAAWTSWLGYGGTYLLGLALAALAALSTSLMLHSSGVSVGGQFGVFSLLILAPVVGLWLTHTRSRRSAAAGLTSAWVVLAWLLFIWHPWDTMSRDEVDRATAEIIASGFPALYLGERAGPFDWNGYYLANSQVNFFYGKCRRSDVDAGCTDWDIDVHNQRTDVRREGDFIAGCTRLDPIQGAAAITLGGWGLDRPEHNIGVFTGSTMVIIRFADDDIGLDMKVALAETLRPVGATRATTLAPPARPALAYVERNCDTTGS